MVDYHIIKTARTCLVLFSLMILISKKCVPRTKRHFFVFQVARLISCTLVCISSWEYWKQLLFFVVTASQPKYIKKCGMVFITYLLFLSVWFILLIDFYWEKNVLKLVYSQGTRAKKHFYFLYCQPSAFFFWKRFNGE